MVVGFPNVTACDGVELLKLSWYTSSVSSAVISSVMAKTGSVTEMSPGWKITVVLTLLPDILTVGSCVPGPECACNKYTSELYYTTYYIYLLLQ